MKNVLLVLTILLSNILTSSATHLMGGEITWECLPNGQFQFTMKAYRDCNSGIITIDVSNGLEVFNYPTVGSPTFSIPLNLVSQTDISPTCNSSGPALSCNNPGGTAGLAEEFIFKTDPVTLTGTPPAEGWIFSHDGCCRNATVTNLVNAGNEGFVLRAKMFAFNGINTNPCYDASPAFSERPSLLTCAGYPVTYSHNAFDREHDSLSYSWSNALDDFFGPWSNTNPPALNYNAGYSATSPLPGTIQNPDNVPVSLNAENGVLSFLSYTPGNFVTVVKVEAWKCGTKVAEIYREIQLTVLAGCALNNPPVVSPPGGIFVDYSATVSAGELVTFTLNGTDADFLPNADPQSVIITATGNQFGTNFTDANSGCMYPPCATLNPPPPASGAHASSVTFNWQTDCNHLSSNTECVDLTSSTYTFAFRVRDDFCPMPAETVAIITIVVVSDSLEDAPSLRCVSVLPNGDAELNWVPTVSNYGTFNSYHIFHSSNSGADFTSIDTIADINSTTYTHVGANADNAEQYYYIRTRSGCDGQIYGAATDTFTTILPSNTDSTDNVANLEWNALATPLPNTTLSGYYRIYRMLPGGNWTLIDSTQSLTYQDNLSVCNDSIYYRVEIEDNSGCISVSAITGGDFLTDVTADFTSSVSGSVSYSFVNVSENALFYSWDFGDGGSSQSINTTHTFADTGSYVVTLIAWNNCDTDTFIMPLTVTGIHEAAAVNTFQIYPNPATTRLTIQTEHPLPNTNNYLQMYNAMGQLVHQSAITNSQFAIDVQRLSPGIYYLSIINGTQVVSKKFVKE